MNTLDKIKAENITYLEANINYTILHFNDGSKQIHSYTLKRFEEQLCNNNHFQRFHRGFIVNKEYIQKRLESPTNKLILKCGTEIPISRRRK